MESINRISLAFVTRARARKLRLLAVCALLAAAGLARFDSRPAQAKQAAPLQGAAAIRQLKAGGDYASLAQALRADSPSLDPILAQQRKLIADDGAANVRFGMAVAISGDTAVIGAPDDDTPGEDQGSAYIFTRSGGVWTKQQKLTAADGAAIDGFGFSVAIYADTVVVGAPLGDVGANADQGSAYVFTRSGGVWTQQKKLTADDGTATNFFGLSVGIYADTVVAGAFFANVGAINHQGSAYVFTRSGANWTQQQKLIANDGEGLDFFGRSVAIYADTVVVGAITDDAGANFDQGSAYVFTRSGGVWTQQQKLTADDGAAGDEFGVSVAIDADTLVVGAPDDDIGGNFDVGSAYVFTRSGAAWTQQQKLIADDGAMVDFFGITVGVSGDTVVVGLGDDDIGENADQGSAYVFARSFTSGGAVWTTRQKLTASDGAAVDRFGSAVALSGDTVVVGAALDDIGANKDQGSAYVFVSSAGPAVAYVSAASFTGTSLAPESIVAAFGGGLAKSTEAATAQPLPTMLDGTQVNVLDSAGTERFAPLFFISPTQINFQIPPGTATGKALVTIIQDSAMVAAASPQIEMVSPGLFSANASGQGVVIGVALRVKADGTQSFEPVVRFDEGKRQFVAAPINLDSASDNVFLILFGTGLRNRSALSAVGVKVGGVNAEAVYAGPQGSFAGLDQLNVMLPRNLAGRGEVGVDVMINGQGANKLKVAIR
ncbi:MAG: hypothetical protein AB7U82_22350 [Blastocatellales bacterium]